MRTSLNSIESSLFDFAILNFSGTSKLAPENLPLKSPMVLQEETGAMVKLSIKHTVSVRLGDCYNADYDKTDDTNRYDEDAVSELSYITTPVAVFEYGEDEDFDGEEDGASSPMTVALTLNSCHALADALYSIHASDSRTEFRFEDAPSCDYNVHIFSLKTNDEENDETHFGLLSRRNTETGEAKISLIVTQAMPLYRKFGHIRICDSDKFQIDAEYGRILLNLIGSILPSDILDTCRLDNVLVGYTDVSSENGDIIERICEIECNNTLLTDYSKESGTTVLAYADYNLDSLVTEDDEDEDEELELEEEDEYTNYDGDEDEETADVVSVASIVLPLAVGDKIKDLDAISDFDFDGLIHRTAINLGMKISRVQAISMN